MDDRIDMDEFIGGCNYVERSESGELWTIVPARGLEVGFELGCEEYKRVESG